MEKERYEKVQSLFDHALQLPETERAQFLEDACHDDPRLRHEVETLLSSDKNAGSFLQAPACPPTIVDPLLGQRVGPYLVKRVIGQGGMGEVYEAERDDAF